MSCTYRRKRIPDLPAQAVRALDDEFYAIEQIVECLQEGVSGANTNLSVVDVTGSAITVACDTGADAVLPAATATTAGVMTSAQVTALGAAVPQTRQVITANGLQGGGALTGNLTLSPVYGSTANTVCQGDDPRLGGSATGATDLGVSNITDSTLTLTSSTGSGVVVPAATATTAGVATATQVTKLDGIQAGAVAAGASGDAFAASHPTSYDHTLIATAVQPARGILTSDGLQGGGDLSADRTLSPVYGTTATTVCQGNDGRLSNARTPTAHATTHATAGTDPVTPAAIGAASATHTHVEANITDLDRMRFKSLWNATTNYVKNDVVIDGPYIAVAKAATTDKPAPVFTQDAPDWLMSDGTTGWQELTGQRFLGHRYGPLSGDTLVQGVRFFSLSASVIQYAYLLVNGVGRYDVAKNLAVPATTWLEIRFPPFVLRAPDVIDFVLFVDGTHKYSWGPDSWPAGSNVKSFESWDETYPPTEFGLTQFGADVLIQSGTMSANWSILCKSAT